MMDESTVELLSRFLDGDLDVAEEERVRQLLAESEAARRELEGMRRIQRAMRDLAERDAPPTELDALLEPLRRTAPTRPSVRPGFAWLAAAASVLLAVGVAYQVARHQTPAPPGRAPSPARLEAPRPPEPARPADSRSRQAEHGRPQPSHELVGAADRFMATPVPQPPVSAPPALDVVGPLPEAPQLESAPDGEPAAAEERAQSRFAPDSPAMIDDGIAAGRAQEAAPPAAGRVAPSAQKARALSRPSESDSAARAWLEVGTADGRLRFAMVADDRLSGGPYEIEVEVAGERVEACRAAPGESRLAQVDVACSELVGATLASLADGTYHGRVLTR